MFERARNAMARGFHAIAARVSTEDRYPEQSRIPYSGRTIAGVAVTPDNVMSLSTSKACVTYISESVAGLPWHVMMKTKLGNEHQSMHPVDWLLHKRPNPEWSSFQFRETMTSWALRWGNGYAEIERDSIGRPFALHPIPPWRVEVCRDRETNALYYEVDNGTDGKVEIDPADMFHVRGFGEGVVGVNMMQYAAQSIGWARAAQLFGASFFGNGATPALVIKNKKGLTEAGQARQRADFEAMHKGPTRANKVAFLDNDADIETIGLNAEETQLINVHHFLVEEQCRWWGVPPHIVAHLLRATNNNIEHQGIEAVQRAIVPWVKRFEDEADFKLFGQNRRGLYTKMNLLGLLRGDFKSQADGFKVYREMGVVNADEIRERLDMNKMEPGLGGEKYTMNGSYMTLEQIGEEPAAPAALPAPTPAPEPDDDAQMAMREFIAAGGKVIEHVD